MKRSARSRGLPATGVVAFVLMLAACAGPPLTLYTLGPDMVGADHSQAAPAAIIAVARVSLPDALDTQDIMVRDGATLKRSSTGRWAERLSLGITDLVTAKLAARYPRALVTDQPQTGPVTERLAINISQLDVTSAGRVSLAADWTYTPADPNLPVRLERTRVTLGADTATDADTVQAIRDAVTALAERIGMAQLAERYSSAR